MSVKNFCPNLNYSFPLSSNHVIEELSSDLHDTYKICLGVILGDIDMDLRMLQVGQIFQARWVTLGCETMQYYVSFDKPSKNLKILVEFCTKVYFFFVV